MGDLRAISGVGPEAGALELLGRMGEQICAETLKPDGMLVIWFTDEGLVDYDYTESLGVEQIVAMAAIVQAMAVQEYISE